MAGRLLVIEGIDGSGKSTQLSLLKDRLERTQIPFRYQRFPRYDRPSAQLLKMYLNGEFGTQPGDVNPYAASAFFSVDRAAAFLEGLGAFHRDGGLLLCDRYTTSNAVHQASKLPEAEQEAFVDWLFDFEYDKLGLPRPDLVLFLDMSAKRSAELIQRRGQGLDIHESDLVHLTRSAEAARRISDRYGWIRISCEQDGRLRPMEEIAEEIFEKACPFIKNEEC